MPEQSPQPDALPTGAADSTRAGGNSFSPVGRPVGGVAEGNLSGASPAEAVPEPPPADTAPDTPPVGSPALGEGGSLAAGQDAPRPPA